MKFALLTVIFFLQCACAFTQRSRYPLTGQEQKYLATLKGLVHAMRSRPAAAFNMQDSSSANSKLYDDLIAGYFNYPAMMQLFGRDTAVFNVESKLYLLKSILAGCDKWAHFIPADSIFIRPPHVLGQRKQEKSVSTMNLDEERLEVYVLLNGKPVTVLSCLFHRQTAKLLAIDPVSVSEDESQQLQKFLKESRH